MPTTKPYYKDSHITEIHGHAPVVLKELPPESVHCIVTSPPYWGLRDYGLEPQIWDEGEAFKYMVGKPSNCEHEWGAEKILEKCGKPTQPKGIFEGRNLEGIQGGKTLHQGQFCQLCNAWRGSLGLEPTPELYIQHIVQIWRELKRVLRKDGVCWLNLGDSYAGSGGPGSQYDNKATGQFKEGFNKYKNPNREARGNLKPKDLCLIPSRVALALQADGWWLRSDIIWSKPNPMPESVTDRPTNSYEHVFLLTKSGKYFYDADAVREPAQDWGVRDRTNWSARINAEKYGQKPHTGGENGNYAESGRNLRNVWTIATEPFSGTRFVADYESADGKFYKVSKDCPIHGHYHDFYKKRKAEYGEQPDFSENHISDTSKNHVEGFESESFSIPSHDLDQQEHENSHGHIDNSNPENKTSDSNEAKSQNHLHIENKKQTPSCNSGCSSLLCSQTAIDHNKQNHKKGLSLETSPSCNSSEETLDHIDDKQALPCIKYKHAKCTCQEVSVDHFATFPQELVKKCILAGTSEKGCCPECGALWVRVVEKTNTKPTPNMSKIRANQKGKDSTFVMPVRYETATKTIGWKPSCKCNTTPIPCTVLDPFSGSGKALIVAKKFGRKAIGIDLKQEYLDMPLDKLAQERLF